MWRAGQCVTINGKTFRIKKLKQTKYGCCIFCEFKNEEATNFPCSKCCNGELMQEDCYFKRIWMARDFSKDFKLSDEELEEIESLI